MSSLTTPFPRYVGNLAKAVGEGIEKGGCKGEVATITTHRGRGYLWNRI